MRLLFDQNLSHLLVATLSELHAGSAHVREFGLERADDAEIWSFAIEHGYAIVTKDSDFPERALLEGPPPKVVWIQLGNCSTREIETLLRQHHAELVAFDADEGAALLSLA